MNMSPRPNINGRIQFPPNFDVAKQICPKKINTVKSIKYNYYNIRTFIFIVISAVNSNFIFDFVKPIRISTALNINDE